MLHVHDARRLLDELNDYATASAALQWLFEDFDAERQRLLARLLRWQGAAATSSLETMVTVCHAMDGEDVGVDMDADVDARALFLVMGKPALLFATSIYDEELAQLIWRGFQVFQAAYPTFALRRQVMDNTMDGHGFCALHYAIDAQMTTFFAEVCQRLATEDAVAFHRELAFVRTQDVVLPVSKTRMSADSIVSGGCTLLHWAAKKGEEEMVASLVHKPVAMTIVEAGADWDGMTVEDLARLHKRIDVVAVLQSACSCDITLWSEQERAIRQRERDAIATARYTDSMTASPVMTKREVFPHIWSHHECEFVRRELEAVTASRGWNTQRHTSYPTTDLPCYQVASVYPWVQRSLVDRLFTQVCQRYSLPKNKMLTFRELFYVKYEARAGEQAALPLHCDGSVLSFNVLLNPRSEFTGGGTYFEADDATVHINQGEAVVHSGKVRHAGAMVMSGTRMILVGFLGLVDRPDW